MKNEILAAYKQWREGPKRKVTYTITSEDRRVANISEQYSENDLRHALVMKAAYNRQSKPAATNTPTRAA